MEGRTHRYFSDFLTTLVIEIMTCAYSKSFWGIIIVLGLLMTSSLFYGRASNIRDQIKEKRKNDLSEELEKHLKKIFNTYEWSSYAFLISAMAYTIVSANFLPDGRYVSSGIALISLMINSFAGATYPDRDWDYGSDAHRSFLTHSWVIPYSVWAFAMAVIPYEQRYFLFPVAIFCVAYASHLFADRVNSSVHGTFKAISEFIRSHKCPGDLRGVPKKSECKILFASGFILIAAFLITLPRIYGKWGFDWTNSTTYSVIFAASVAVSWIIWYVLKMRYKLASSHFGKIVSGV